MKKYLNLKNVLLVLVVVFSLLRFGGLWYPNKYVFDEVYHAFTAKEYLSGSKVAWEWWNTPPSGVAYEWTHPPLAKELMAASMWTFHSTDAWAWRFPGALMSCLSIFMVYKIAKKLFDQDNRGLSIVGLLSALMFSIDGLNFVQARTGMNDAYVVAFLLSSLYLSLQKKWIYGAILLGLALASKWSAIYMMPLFFLVMLQQRTDRSDFQLPFTKKRLIHIIVAVLPYRYYLAIPLIIYLLSYLPFFLHGHSFDLFVQLQQQMWWYHTNLKATHDYASPWWSWPFNLYPVWYFVDYHTAGWMSNIFSSGNLPLFLFGFVALLMMVWEWITKKTWASALVLMGYISFIIPWAFSPRIMFLYHYSPSIPFLALALGYQLNKLDKDPDSRQILYTSLGILIIGFLFFYPFLVGIPLPSGVVRLFFLTNLTKDPFGFK